MMQTKILVSFLALFLSLSLMAQSTKEEHTQKKHLQLDEWITDFRKEGLLFTRKGETFRGHWMGVELGLNGLRTADNQLNLAGTDNDQLTLKPLQSWTLAINPIRFSVPVSKPNFGFVTGLGLRWNSFAFEHDFVLANHTTAQPPDGVELHNRLNLVSVTVPLMLELQLPAHSYHKFHLSGGLTASYVFAATQKRKWKENDTKLSYRASGKPLNINRFQYGLTARLGFSYVHFFANYSLSSLFESQGADVYPFSAGIVLLNL